ncbi:putative toxin-antitoxin system toxin component, PIN family [Prosthecodimorpha hirschii]|nr:putative toxin-antitoxin system toxin component, PIN family [Prosthecomicrobium hirschii]
MSGFALDIVSDMRVVLDTSVLVSAVRSPKGVSAHLVRLALLRRLEMAVSVALFLEYEAVLSRPEHLAAAGASLAEVSNLMNALAGVAVQVEVSFLWRPQLRDPDDDMVLEAAVNGQAEAIVTFNPRDFHGTRSGFGIDVLLPAECVRRI